MRPSILRFAEVMEQKLARNDWKCGWNNEPQEWLFERLLHEVGELAEAIGKMDSQAIIEEAADVANFAHMIADVAQGCPDGPRGMGK